MAVVAAAVAVLLDVSDPPTAHAATASDPIALHRDGRFFIRNQPGGGHADDAFRFGRDDDVPLLGDWDGDGELTPAVRRGPEFMFRNARSGGSADVSFAYGRGDDLAIAGDWDGDGTDEVGVVRDGRFLLRTSLGGGAADIAFRYGRSQDIPLSGDWDGDGTDEVGVVRDGRFLLRTSLGGGAADIAFRYGRSQDIPIAGDWDGDGTDEVGVVRDGRFLLRTSLGGGAADIAFHYGRSQDIPLGGTSAGHMPLASDDDGDPSVETLERGDDGPAVAALQRELRDSRYWVGAIDGIYGLNTEHAVLAVQKAHGLTRDGTYGPATRAALSDGSPPAPRSTSGNVVEFDEDRQLLLLVQDGVTRWTFHAAGGDESYYTYGGTTYWAETPNGRWNTYRQIDGWRTSRLGELYRPKYFHTDGIAVHGYTSVPAYAASHGCVRVGMDQMDWIWANGEMPIGRAVWVYGSP